MRIEVLNLALGCFLGIIISSTLILVFLILPQANYYYFLIINERLLMVFFLTIGWVIGFGILSSIVLVLLFKRLERVTR